MSGELYSKESDTVKEFYTQCSFFTKALLGQPADFIAIELEFLSTLLSNLHRDEVFKNILIEFLKQNFLSWVKTWIIDLKTNSKSFFYKGLAFQIEEFCDMLIEEFDIKDYEKKVYRKAS